MCRASEDKDATGSAGTDPDGILNVALRDLAKDLGEATVLMADTCLDEFTDHGHCGVLDDRGRVDNDATLARYVELAVAQAESGAHVVGPSGMMDGQVGAIRDGLDAAGYTDVAILAYAAKFASAFYGPFREAVSSSLSGDRRTYQQEPGNAREALREIALDLDEGADIVMVKPAMGYLDVVAAAADDLAGAGGRLPGLGGVRDDLRRGREQLDRRARRGAGVIDEHPARRSRYRADLLGRGRGGLGFRDGAAGNNHQMRLQMTSQRGIPTRSRCSTNPVPAGTGCWQARSSAVSMILIEVWSGAGVGAAGPGDLSGDGVGCSWRCRSRRRGSTSRSS